MQNPGRFTTPDRRADAAPTSSGRTTRRVLHLLRHHHRVQAHPPPPTRRRRRQGPSRSTERSSTASSNDSTNKRHDLVLDATTHTSSTTADSTASSATSHLPSTRPSTTLETAANSKPQHPPGPDAKDLPVQSAVLRSAHTAGVRADPHLRRAARSATPHPRTLYATTAATPAVDFIDDAVDAKDPRSCGSQSAPRSQARRSY